MRIFGTSGADALDVTRLLGPRRAAEILGKGGDDRLRGGGLADLLAGGQGNDTLQSGDGDDTLLGGGGNDVFVLSVAGEPRRVLRGDAGIDTLVLRLDAATLAQAPVQAEIARINTALVSPGGGGFVSTLFGIDATGLERLVVVSDAGTEQWLSRAAKPAFGLQLRGERAGDLAGSSVAAAGDVNGDGLADLLVGVPNYRGTDDSNPGAAFVVFGKADGATVRLGDIARDGVGGFLIRGAARFDQAGGAVAAAGDIDGDGLDDLLIGAIAADGEPGDVGPSGAAYLVRGKTDGAVVRLADVAAGTGGFRILGERGDDRAGLAVTSAGDLNGDGNGDFLVGADGHPRAPGNFSGAAYLVFGAAGTTAIDLDDIAQGTGGVGFVGERNGDQVGTALAVADVNGDGALDVILGAPGFDGPAGSSTGAAYVVFGGDWGGTVDLADIAAGRGGFRITGAARFDNAGIAVAAAGDVNGDGLTDVLIGADGRDRGNQTDAGAAYLVFGKTDGSAIDLAAVERGEGGFRLSGARADDGAGFAVSAAGDLNGDGLHDLLIGAPLADTANGLDSGGAYVLFGRAEWLLP